MIIEIHRSRYSWITTATRLSNLPHFWLPLRRGLVMSNVSSLHVQNTGTLMSVSPPPFLEWYVVYFQKMLLITPQIYETFVFLTKTPEEQKAPPHIYQISFLYLCIYNKYTLTVYMMKMYTHIQAFTHTFVLSH